MKFIDEYRDISRVNNIADKLKSCCIGQWKLMEVCGGQTHNILKFGLEQFLPEGITLIHGPGCPVCVTPVEIIDKAIAIAREPDVILVTYGDMLRVPGSATDLLSVKAEGADVRSIYSPMDSIALAEEYRKKKIVFFAIGFETTAPANAAALLTAKKYNITNYYMLSAHVLIPPAIELLLSENSGIQGLIAPGHVCTVTGSDVYDSISQKYKVPIAITGFEPVDILYGILSLIVMLESGSYGVNNTYARSVKRNGNVISKKIIENVFEVTGRRWRGIGIIPGGGLRLKKEFSDYDAEIIFNLQDENIEKSTQCISGEILKGLKKPVECPAFKKLCTPEKPLGAPMVSSEGACSAYFRYKTRQV